MAFLLVFCCLAGHWLPLRHITNICLQLVSLLFHIPRICCSSTVISFSFLYISQSSCLLECLAITHHVGEYALAICVSVDLSTWWYSCFPCLDSELQSYWLLLSSWSSSSFSISTFQKLMYGLWNDNCQWPWVRLKVTFAVLNLCNTRNSGNIVYFSHTLFKNKFESALGSWFKVYCQRWKVKIEATFLTTTEIFLYTYFCLKYVMSHLLTVSLF